MGCLPPTFGVIWTSLQMGPLSPTRLKRDNACVARKQLCVWFSSVCLSGSLFQCTLVLSNACWLRDSFTLGSASCSCLRGFACQASTQAT